MTLAFIATSTAQPAARQVLVLNSFERGSAVENQFAGRFRTELGRQSPEPLNIFEVSLQPSLAADGPQEAASTEYLLSTFGSDTPDLVVTLGGPAAAFAQRNRARLFPSTPTLLAAVDRRSLQAHPSSTNETALAVATDPSQIVDGILRLLPETRTLFVVIGASRIEQFWRAELTQRLQPFESRLHIEWSSELSFEETLQRAGSLPPQSAIFYTLLSVDARGALQEEERTLARLHAVANAPLFGLYDIQLGHGIVGGSLLGVDEVVRDSVDVAVRLLRGESPGSIKTPPHTAGRPTFDWRELRRWSIGEARLPENSIVQFRQPTVWEEYRSYIVGVTVVVALQSTLIALLVVQRARRRRSELALRQSEHQQRQLAEHNQALAGRLITAQDAERSRIARDLHDDVSQQLAGVSIAFSGLKQQLSESRVSADLQQELANLQHQTLALARNVRHLSHDLHPTVLQHLGLAKALTSYCSELERSHGVVMRCEADGDFSSMSPEAGLCVYRIAQEALRNVVAHAGARHADIRLHRRGDDVEMTITDDGHGFDAQHQGARQGLGLVSITERAKLAGGTIVIDAAHGRGTRVRTTIPLYSPAVAGGIDGRVA